MTYIEVWEWILFQKLVYFRYHLTKTYDFNGVLFQQTHCSNFFWNILEKLFRPKCNQRVVTFMWAKAFSLHNIYIVGRVQENCYKITGAIFGIHTCIF